jgi:hypothetical protein
MGEDRSFETEWQNEAVCPHCFYRHQDTWEFYTSDDGDDIEASCHQCGKDFGLTRHVSTDYSTKKIKESPASPKAG